MCIKVKVSSVANLCAKRISIFFDELLIDIHKQDKLEKYEYEFHIHMKFHMKIVEIVMNLECIFSPY